MITTGVVFQTENISVVHTPGTRSDVVAVTFTPLQHKEISPPEGFAQRFFEKRGIPSVCFVSHWDHWWQVNEMEQALNVARAVTSNYRRVMTYGTSMGGYGALAYSGKLDATEVVAFSPQYSIDGQKVPFETRWRRHADRLSFENDSMDTGLRQNANILLGYDPDTLDGLHVQKIKANNARHLKVPMIGHGVIAYLNATGVLGPILTAAADGNINVDPYMQIIHDKRQEWPAHWISLADDALAKESLHEAVNFLQRAIALEPNSFSTTIKLARTYERLKDVENAAIWYPKAFDLRPSDKYAQEKAIRFLSSTARSRLRDGLFEEALKKARLAVTVDPENDDMAELAKRATTLVKRSGRDIG